MKRKLKTISLGLTLIGSLSYFTVFAEVNGGSGSGGGGCDGKFGYELEYCYRPGPDGTQYQFTQCINKGSTCPAYNECNGIGSPK